MKRLRIFGPAAVALIAAATFLPAQEPIAEENKGFMAAKGRVTFRRYCASCHGEKADGTGPVARMLKVVPSDLRNLSEDNGGEYPADRVAAFIDGREEVAAHGRRDMPVWGEVFQTPLVANPATPEEEAEERATRKGRELVLYLQTVQKRAPAAVEPKKKENG